MVHLYSGLIFVNFRDTYKFRNVVSPKYDFSFLTIF